jgi:hypothetical protein
VPPWVPLSSFIFSNAAKSRRTMVLIFIRGQLAHYKHPILVEVSYLVECVTLV